MAQQLGAEPPEPHDPPLARQRSNFSGPADVALWPLADAREPLINVCLRGQSGHHRRERPYPVLTQDGHR
jgi:hypothetical protein